MSGIHCVEIDGYPYMEHLLEMEACQLECPVVLPQYLRQVETPLNWREWDLELATHPDQRFRAYIVDGIRKGFRVGCTKGPAGNREKPRKNMPSAQDKPEVIDDYLAEECSRGRVIGPLDQQLVPQVHVNRFGVIPKGTSGKWRLIVDMSFPPGSSVNDGINESVCSLSYVGVREAVKGILARGRGTQMAKVDVKSAYRNVPVHPDDRWLMGMRWRGSVFVDLALPFGLRSAPKIFTAVADAVEWIVRKKGADFVIHYLDDFLVMGAPETEECTLALRGLLDTFESLGLPVAQDKLEGPDTTLTFLGFELDSRRLEVRLPHGKLEELRRLVQQWKGKRSGMMRDLESLIGKLAHAAQVVGPGKTFLRRMFELKAAVQHIKGKFRLSSGFRSDILWWASFLDSWNGVRMMSEHSQLQAKVHIWTDASGNFGCGAWDPAVGEWIQLSWAEVDRQDGLREESITAKELVPIVVACAIWGRRWVGQAVRVSCDNTGAVAAVNSGYSRSPQLMHLLRCLFFIRAHFQLEVWACHIPGIQNTVADAISRNNLSVFFSQAPQARRNQTPVPQGLRSLLLEQQPDWTSTDWVALFSNCFRQA